MAIYEKIIKIIHTKYGLTVSYKKVSSILVSTSEKRNGGKMKI